MSFSFSSSVSGLKSARPLAGVTQTKSFGASKLTTLAPEMPAKLPEAP